jgi:hypothetical protein
MLVLLASTRPIEVRPAGKLYSLFGRLGEMRLRDVKDVSGKATEVQLGDGSSGKGNRGAHAVRACL